MLPEAVLQYDPPGRAPDDQTSPIDDSKLWLHSQCRYARICSTIAAVRNSHQSLNSKLELDISKLPKELEEWYSSVPKAGQLLRDRPTASPIQESRHIAVCTLYQYQEANLAILSLPTSSEVSTESNLTSSQPVCTWSHVDKVVASIKQIFAASHKIEDLMYDR